MLNEINSHKMKLIFLTLLGNDGYALIHDLCTPSKLIDKSYVALKKMLSEHINPKPNMLTERYKFKEKKQEPQESICQFVAALKNLFQCCEFGTNLDDSLRDQVVYGIRDNNIKKRLLSESELSFKRCIEICLLMEAANNDILTWGKQEEINYQWSVKIKPSDQRSVTGEGRMICYCCELAGHKKPFCKYKDFKCEFCARVGHLKKVCKAKGKLGNVNVLEQRVEILNEDLNMDNLFNLEVADCKFIEPFKAELRVNEKIIKFQIDTGSSITAISLEEFQKVNLKEGNMQVNDINLKAYTGDINYSSEIYRS